MIDAAEKLIAEHGIAAMTLKDVQIAAGQLNKSAAKYHFGSREGLIDAIIEARMSAVNERRAKMLEDLEQSGSKITARRALVVLIRPLAVETLGREGSRYARFLSQAIYDPALAESIQKHLRAVSYRRTEDIVIGLANAPHEIAKWRASNIVNLTLITLAGWEAQERGVELTNAIISDLIDTAVAVLEAPVSEPLAAGSLSASDVL